MAEGTEDPIGGRITVGKRSRWDLVGFLRRFIGTLRELRPTVVYAFDIVPGLLAIGARSILPRYRVVVGLRSAKPGGRAGEPVSRVLSRILALLSPAADSIIANSRAGAEFHAAYGYAKEHLTVIANGVDLERFAPATGPRERLRAELGLEAGQVLVGDVGRLIPLKDHGTFLAACRDLATRSARFHFAIVGDGDEQLRQGLVASARAHGLADRLHWLGVRNDMPTVYSALDVLVSTSLSEGFPNVILEAMACGCPCVVTDAGDSALIVGEHGVVVPFRDPAAVVAGVEQLSALDQTKLRRDCRDSVARRFGVPVLVVRTREVLGV
jgi:glycosyltransferase involved in cell wall biosynthesis